MHWSFGKYWFTELCTSSKYYILLHNLKIIFINITTDLITHLHTLGNYEAHSGRSKFSKNSNFHLKAHILLFAINTISCFPWSVKFILPARYLSLDYNGFLVVLLSKTDVPWYYIKKKVVSLACNPNLCTGGLSLRHCPSVCFLCASYSITHSH